MTYVCCITGLRRESCTDRLPPGWKRIGERTYSPDGLARAYLRRAIVVPISGPLDATWAEFREALRVCWADSTACANWMLRECYVRDVRRTAATPKLPPQPRTYLYPEARALWPQLPSQTVAQLEQLVQRRYRAQRYDVVWTQAATLATYRYPAPYVVPAQGWSLDVEDQRLVVSARLGERRWRLRLAQGPGQHRQIRTLRGVLDGTAVPGALSLYRVRDSAADHRSGVTERAPGGGQTVRYRVMAAIPLLLPRAEARGRTGVLHVETTPQALWWCRTAGRDEPWVYHADHVRRWILQHATRLQSLADDEKFERRRPARVKRRLDEARARWCVLHARRMASALHEATAALVGFARRQRVAEVIYDDSQRVWVTSFPWRRLRALLGEKLDAAGIALTVASAVTTPDDPGPLAAEESGG